jgi:phage-related protein
MAQQIKIDIVADVQKLQQGVDQVNKQLGGLDSSVKKVQGLTTAFAGVAVAAKGFNIAGGFINETTDAASNLEETLTKTNELFGTSTKEVVAFSKTAAKNLGQSSQQALDASANFAIFGKAAGLAGGDLVDFSTDFTVLASDLASFNNTSPQEAINAIGSALRGEAEPLRKYGVLLNDAALRQAALELGIVQTTKEALTPQQKVLAAQKVIYEQTTAAQGDFARTSDGLANSTRILEAEQADLNANIGETFLPVMKQVNNVMRLAIGIFTSLPGPIQQIIVVVGLAIAILGPFLLLINAIKTAMVALQVATLAKAAAVKVATAAQAIFNAVMAANPIALVILAIVAIIAIIVLLVKNWDTVTAAVSRVWNAISNFGKDAWEALKTFGSRVSGFVDGIRDAFNALPKAMLNVGKNIVTGLWDGIQGMSSWLLSRLGSFFGNLLPGWVKKILGISSPSKVFAQFGEQIVEGLAGGINTAKSIAERATLDLGQSTIGGIGLSGLSNNRSFGSAINITINAGLGTDPYLLGKEVNNAIRKYGKINSTAGRF